ncbi:hypothetical protein [Actinomadura monticuli]|uniref:Uncharacterized protein n=1 Tax=Actinomadura monticuli TaxID=3097367 RepID=A0ABV4QDK4_9ACTN
MDDPQHQSKRPVSALAGSYGHPLHPIPVRTAAAPGSAQPARAPESAFPIPVVLAHGLLAVATLILVLLSALQA